MPTPTVIDKYRYSDVINRRYWDKYWFDNFQLQPVTSAVGGGAATGVAGDNNVLYTAFGQYEWNVIGTQTILAPKLDTFGLNLVQDATAGDGIELCMGRTALCPIGFTIGQDNAFFMQYKFKIEDATGCNPMGIGFIKAQAFNATLASYTDLAFIGIVGTAAKIQTVTNLNNAGAVTTDTTDVATDGSTIQLQINVSSSGVVTYQYNYEEPTVVAAFQFDDGDYVIPIIRFTMAADLTTQASTNYLEVGFQS